MPNPNQQFKQLRRAIQDAGYLDRDFAAAMGVSGPVMSNRLSGKAPWMVSEALKACELLHIPPEDFCIYFKDCAAR